MARRVACVLIAYRALVVAGLDFIELDSTNAHAFQGRTPKREQRDVTETPRRDQTLERQQFSQGVLPSGLVWLLAPGGVWFASNYCHGLLFHFFSFRQAVP